MHRSSAFLTTLVLEAVSRARAARAARDEGATLVEYAFLIALIAIVCVAAVSLLGGAARSNLSRSGSSLFTP